MWHCFAQLPLVLSLLKSPSFRLFIFFTSLKRTSLSEQVGGRREKKKIQVLCLLLSFLRGQSGRSVNEWQTVLITRRGYLGSLRLISPNAFRFLMRPNCRLHKAGPFIKARQPPASNESRARSPERPSLHTSGGSALCHCRFGLPSPC